VAQSKSTNETNSNRMMSRDEDSFSVIGLKVLGSPNVAITNRPPRTPGSHSLTSGGSVLSADAERAAAETEDWVPDWVESPSFLQPESSSPALATIERKNKRIFMRVVPGSIPRNDGKSRKQAFASEAKSPSRWPSAERQTQYTSRW
jgi:hypothetical protein